ncbi:MAG TPA: hypothetical protein VEX68_24125 [Bryobacteraceae bacterium]|nr:hypothetical protein [Bryobacteraceae bacterium]
MRTLRAAMDPRDFIVTVLDEGIADEFAIIEEQYDQADMSLVQACAQVFGKLDGQSASTSSRPVSPTDSNVHSAHKTRSTLDSAAVRQKAKWQNEPNNRIHAVNLPRISETQPNAGAQQRASEAEPSP